LLLEFGISGSGVNLGLGSGFIFNLSAGIPPQRFTKYGNLANGIASGGTGVGAFPYSLSANAMIQYLGLAWAFRILCILQFVVNTISAMLPRDRNEAIGNKLLVFDVQLLQMVELLLMLAWSFFSVFGFIVLLFSMPNYAASIGLTPAQGLIVGALLSLFQGLTRPPFRYLSDAAGLIATARVATALACMLCFWGGGDIRSEFWSCQCIHYNARHNLGHILQYGGSCWCRSCWLVELQSALSIAWISIVPPGLFVEPIDLELETGGY
jgi:hypothetical protein